MADSNHQCAEALLDVVPRILYVLRRNIRSRRGVDLSIPQFRTLSFIGRHPGCTVSGTATDLGLSTPATSRLVDGLIAAGLARRRADARDRRCVALSLTVSGRRKYRAARNRARAFLARRLDDLGEGERAVLLEALGCLCSVFEEGQSTGAS